MPIILNAVMGWHHTHTTRVVYTHIPEMCLLTGGAQRLSQVPIRSFRYRATVYDPGGVQLPSPIADYCMLPSSHAILSASSTTTFSRLTTFTCVAAR